MDESEGRKSRPDSVSNLKARKQPHSKFAIKTPVINLEASMLN